jgi:hypothetical protein
MTMCLIRNMTVTQPTAKDGVNNKYYNELILKEQLWGFVVALST